MLFKNSKKRGSGKRVTGSYRRYRTLIKHLRNFARVKYGYTDVSFSDLTPPVLCRTLITTCVINIIWSITRFGYMIGFTRLCRLAMSRKHLTFNPFSEYKNTKKDMKKVFEEATVEWPILKIWKKQ
ncbi:phage integrase SAM-like domain-containing protein [Arachidicoccus soli]|uniref:phage integrase SAM-like domain-containing protein n=1 Tax=Arachidicoccus soli TaxID=2341117 RepID=UPI00374351FD